MSFDILYFLEKHAVAITTVTTVILVIVTIFYVNELKQQNSIAVMPYPKLELRPQNFKDDKGDVKRALFLYIENIGRGPLIDPTIKLTEPDEKIIEKNMVLAVGDEKQKIQLDEIEKHQKYDELIINLNYEDIFGKKYNRDFKLDTHINDTIRI